MELQEEQQNHNERVKQEDAKFYLRKRYLVAVLTFVGCISLSSMRVNFHVLLIKSKVSNFNADFLTSPGVILSGMWFHLFGFLIAPLGAVGVRKFGGAVTFGAGVGFTALFTCFTPTFLFWHSSARWISQFLFGIFQGVCTCAVLDVLRLWSIPTERVRLIGLATGGFLIGDAVSFPVGKALASENWRTPFYVTGVFSLLWCMIWFLLVKSSPQEDKFITTEEKNYIKEKRAPIEREVHYSYCSIFKSKPVWAYFIERLVISWSGYFVLSYHPLFLLRMLDSLGLENISNSTYYCYPVGVIGASFLADYLKNNNKENISSVYKLYLSLGQIVVTILLTLNIVFWGNAWLIISSYIAFQLIWAIRSVGYSVLPVDMGGQYATLIAGFGIVAATIGHYAMSQLVILLTPFFYSWTRTDERTDTCFGLMCNIINLLGAFIFYKYGSGDLQPWAVSSSSS